MTDSPAQVNQNEDEPREVRADMNVASRRSFMAMVGKRAMYAVPIILTLTAREARAAASPSNPSPDCAHDGDLCATNSDCCSNLCSVGQCVGG